MGVGGGGEYTQLRQHLILFPFFVMEFYLINTI